MGEYPFRFVAKHISRLQGAARKLPVPEGTFSIGAGLIIVGAAAYGFQILAAHQLSTSSFAALNGLWAIVFVVAPGLFQPLEQEVGRAIAHRRAQGIGAEPLVKRAAVLGGILVLVIAAFSAIFAKPLIDNLFHGYGWLLPALFVGLICYYVAHITRGTLAGNGRFGPYGLMHASEGLVRIGFCAILVLAGTTAVGLYGVALSLPPLFAVAIALRGQHGLLQPGPEAPYSELSSALGLLLVGSLLAQSLSYASFIGVTLLAPKGGDQAGLFITGLFVARIPLLMFQAVQAALLPKLAGLAGEGRHDDFRAGMRRLLYIVIGLGVFGTLVATFLGPPVGKILFGDKWILGNRDMFLLTLAASMFIIALTLAQGLIALKAYLMNAIGWTVGIVAFVVTVAAGTDLYLRNELGFVAGAGSAATMMAIFLFIRLRKGTATLEQLVEVVEFETFEI
jgi:O-antigen/teichoic acid export membrane protein